MVLVGELIKVGNPNSQTQDVQPQDVQPQDVQPQEVDAINVMIDDMDGRIRYKCVLKKEHLQGGYSTLCQFVSKTTGAGKFCMRKLLVSNKNKANNYITNPLTKNKYYDGCILILRRFCKPYSC